MAILYTEVASSVILSVRVPMETKAKLDARLRGRRRTDYLRDLIERDLDEGHDSLPST